MERRRAAQTLDQHLFDEIGAFAAIAAITIAGCAVVAEVTITPSISPREKIVSSDDSNGYGMLVSLLFAAFEVVDAATSSTPSSPRASRM